MASPKKYPDDDIISYSSYDLVETFSSRNSNRKPLSSKQQLQYNIAQELKTKETPPCQEKEQFNKFSPKTQRWNKCFHHYRFVVLVLGGLGCGLMLALRYQISTAILKMVNQEELYLRLHPNSTIEDFLEEGYLPGGDFDWTNEIQQVIMSSYMITYTLPQVFTTKLGLKMGIRYAIPLCISLCSVSALLTPMAAYHGGWKWVLFLRLVNGLGASGVVPLQLNTVEVWMPEDEIFLGLTISSVVLASIAAGTNISTGYLCSIHWIYAFYVFGAIGIIFSLVWLLTVDKPQKSKIVSEEELQLILASMDKQTTEQDAQDIPTGRLLDVFLLPSFYAFLISWIIYCCTINLSAFILPTYFRQILKIRVSENGMYCTIIGIGGIIGFIWPQPFRGLLMKRLHMCNTTATWTLMAISCLCTSSTWLYVGLMHNHQLILLVINQCFHLSVDIITKSAIMSTFSRTGIRTVIVGLINTIGNVTLVFASTLVGHLLDVTGQSKFSWTIILWSLGVSHIIMMLVFCLFTRTEPLELINQKKVRLAQELKELKTESDTKN